MSTNFSPLQAHEKQFLVSQWERHNITDEAVRLLSRDRVAYAIQNNFTVALVKRGKGLHVGVAKRRPDEANNEVLAADIALVRAYRDFS